MVAGIVVESNYFTCEALEMWMGFARRITSLAVPSVPGSIPKTLMYFV
jgi:hypothetical protein